MRSGQIGNLLGFDDLNTAPVLAATTVILSAVLIVLLRSGRRRLALPATGAVLFVWGIALAAYVFPKVLSEHEYLAQSSLGQRPVAERDWIDAVVPGDATVALVPSAINSRGDAALPRGTSTDQAVWWEAEFWNKVVRRNYRHVGAASYTPFVDEAMELNRASGRVHTSGSESAYLVWAPSNVRIGLEAHVVASYPDLALLRPGRPYRAAWATNVSDDGTMTSDRFALTVYGRQRAGARLHRIELLLAPGAESRDRYRVRGPGVQLDGRIAAAPTVSLDVCVPAAGREIVRVETQRNSQARLVRVRVDASTVRC